MEEKRKLSYHEISTRVERARRIYSGIGEPLPVETIIALHRHLGNALEMARMDTKTRKKKCADA